MIFAECVIAAVFGIKHRRVVSVEVVQADKQPVKAAFDRHACVDGDHAVRGLAQLTRHAGGCFAAYVADGVRCIVAFEFFAPRPSYHQVEPGAGYQFLP